MEIKDISNGIKVVEVVENDDGTSTFILDLSQEFQDWFCKEFNLETVDHQIFDDWFKSALEDSLKKIIEKGE